VIVATDDERIADAIRAAGGEADDDLASSIRAAPIGSRRLPERVHAEIYLNVQGDQPFIAPEDLDALAAPMRADPSLAMATLATPIIDDEEWYNPNKVKVVCDARGDALYFSRSPIPWPRARRRHSGSCAPAYRRLRVSARFPDGLRALEPGVLEQTEKLEQLRALERGYRIRVVASVAPSLEVDTAEDLARGQRTAAWRPE
jgi:3-deoxy-manno-octulosonate cytidylyltransferase (CMP-KDO synthetase)